MEEERLLRVKAEEEVVSLREQLSALQDRYMALEESVPSAQVAVVSSSTVASIESLYREQLSALRREHKQARRAAKEARAQAEEQCARAARAQDEAARLRERALELQLETDKLRRELANTAGGGNNDNTNGNNVNSNNIKSDTFDAEGQFQMLYKETLASLNDERDKRRQEAVTAKTELQIAREEKEDAKEEAATLRAELEMQKRRAAELDRAYQNDLRIEKEKEELLEKELARLKQDGVWQQQIDELQRKIEELRIAVAGDLLQEQATKHEADKSLLINKQIAVMEENFGLKSKLEDFELMREKLFFALALALKLNVSLKGGTTNSIDPTELWAGPAQKLHFTEWQKFLEQQLDAETKK